MSLHPEILSPGQLALLPRLAAVPEIRTFYMAGGTALALQVGHRTSVDFDFFRPADFSPSALAETLTAAGPLTVRQAEAGTLTIEISGVLTSFFRYPYALLETTISGPHDLALASPRDIAAMKLAAIAGRGARKDFIDLYFLCREVGPLSALLDLADKKFGAERYDRYHLLKSLVYFEDAEAEVPPHLLRPADWPEIQRFFRDEVRKIVAA